MPKNPGTEQLSDIFAGREKLILFPFHRFNKISIELQLLVISATFHCRAGRSSLDFRSKSIVPFSVSHRSNDRQLELGIPVNA